MLWSMTCSHIYDFVIALIYFLFFSSKLSSMIYVLVRNQPVSTTLLIRARSREIRLPILVLEVSLTTGSSSEVQSSAQSIRRWEAAQSYSQHPCRNMCESPPSLCRVLEYPLHVGSSSRLPVVNLAEYLTSGM